MYKSILLAVAITVITGCTNLNKQAINPMTKLSLGGKAIAYTTRAKPDFIAITTTQSLVGLLTGVSSAIDESNSIIENNNISDPANAIAIAIAKDLAINLGALLNDSPISIDTFDAVEIADKARGEAKFVVDVQTTEWSFGATGNRFSPSLYGVNYSAKALLIDVEHKTVVAEGYCKHRPDNSNAPTYDELLANEASLLKKQLASAVDECVKTIKVQMQLFQ